MAENPDWRRTLKRRITVAAGVLLLWSVGIEARLVHLQVVQHKDLAGRADRQQSRTIDAPAKRGDIVDRNGRVLALSVDADSIYAVPAQIDDPAAVAAALCGTLEDCTPEEQAVLGGRLDDDRAFAYVRRQATPDQAARVAALDLDGVGFMKENRRFYPNKELAANVLGYVGVDGVGLGGIEAAYDEVIKGLGGRVLIQTDARGRPFSRVERPATSGGTLELSIDQYVQHVAERELRAGIEWAGADAGSAIVLDPATGEILAMASYPTFNPNIYGDAEPGQRRNRAVQDIYEPGSTFKIVIAAAALEERVLVADLIETSPGIIRFGSRVIDENNGHDYGLLTFTDVIIQSSNVGAIKIGLQLGAERLGTYVDRFGFGRPASPDFQGESRGIVWDWSRLNDSALASVSMGYQVGVTPLQMVAAAAAVANGGVLMQPRIVRAVTVGDRRTPVAPQLVGQVVAPDVAAELTRIMEGVVERGTGSNSAVPGYTVAGKTGTAGKVIDGRYSTTDYNVSFAGFVPSRQPRFAILVVVDTPRNVPPYGGTVAAPIFQQIAAAALRHYGVPPSVDPSPPLLVARREQARAQHVSPPIALPAIVPLDNPSAEGSFPDLRGLGARDALRVLSRLGVAAELIGNGVVVAQEPAAGSRAELGAAATVWLHRQASPVAVAGGGP